MLVRSLGLSSAISYSPGSHPKQVFKVHNLSPIEATLVEPAACAVHGMDKLNPPVGVEVLLLGAGPTGLILCQLLKLNGAHKVVLGANKGIKMDLAKKMNVADEYIEFDRQDPDSQWKKLKEDNPYGFDIVVGLQSFSPTSPNSTLLQIEATGVEKLANDSFNYVRRGGTLMIYGVYDKSALVHWPPSKIFGDEIKVIVGNPLFHCKDLHALGITLDHWILCSDSLLSSGSCILGQR